jgi:hypothetical protein
MKRRGLMKKRCGRRRKHKYLRIFLEVKSLKISRRRQSQAQVALHSRFTASRNLMNNVELLKKNK